MSGARPRLADYLDRSEDQRRLLEAMSAGHARTKHGRELGEPSPGAYRARVRRHLRRAPIGLEVRDPQGRPRYLIADARTNEVAWITPHREERSTFFVPRSGVHTYLRSVTSRPQGVGPLDLAAVRATGRSPLHSAVRAITSVRRSAQKTAGARVP